MHGRRAAPLLVAAFGTAAAIALCPSTAGAQHANPVRTAGFVTIGAGATLVGVGAVFAVLASVQNARLEMFANARDPMTGLPLVDYSDVQAIEQQRSMDVGLSIGFFAVGIAGIAAGTALALRPVPQRNTASIAIAPTLGGALVRITF